MLLPGFVNNHFHDTSLLRMPSSNPASEVDADLEPPSLFANGGDIERLSTYLGPMGLAARELDDDWCLVSALLALSWQLRGGTTTWADLGSANKPHLLAEASLALGMRGVVSLWGADIACGAQDEPRHIVDADDELARIDDVVAAYRDHPSGRLRAWPTFFAAFAASDHYLTGLADIARAHGTPFSGHIACLDNERAHSQRFFGEAPVARGSRLGLLDARFVGVHTTHLEPQEVDVVVASGMAISHAPSKYGTVGENTNSTATVPGLWRRGVNVTVSTDGNPSVDSTMVEAMRAAYLCHNEISGDHRTCSPYHALRMSSIDAARSLAWDKAVGSIEVGKRADLVVVDIGLSCYVGIDRPLTQFLQLGNHRDVNTVIIDGTVVLDDGALLVVDDERLAHLYAQALADRAKGDRSRHRDQR
jgi:cytosine/adenosine deaminase-related metal-dependent hydrolase